MQLKNCILYLSLSLLITGFSSCVSTDDPSNQPAVKSDVNPIGFRSSLETRGAINKFNSGDKIKVWGYRTTGITDGSDETDIIWDKVFKKSTSIDGSIDVTYDGENWDYAEKEYWKPGNIYFFHAFFSNSDNSNPINFNFDQTTNTLHLNNFDATNHIDLLYGAHIRNYDEEGSKPVSFNFSHILSQVTFIGKVETTAAANIDEIKINYAKIYGIPKTGNWEVSFDTQNNWSLNTDKTTSDASFAEVKDIEIGLDNVNLFEDKSSSGGADNQILTFPLTSLEGVFFEGEYTYKDGAFSDTKTFSFQLSEVEGGPTKWEAGKSYRYNFIININDFILFAPPGVDEWKPGDIGADDALDTEINNG